MNNCCASQVSPEDKFRRYSVQQLLQKQDELNEFIISGWRSQLTEDMLMVAILDEKSELLGSGVSWKWWKFTDPSKLDIWNLKIEMVDAIHFFLSVMMLRDDSRYVAYCGGRDYSELSRIYVGTDRFPTPNNTGILIHPNTLSHSNFISLFRAILDRGMDVFADTHTLARMVGSIGMNSEEFSAIYAVKAKLNEIRQMEGYKDGTYVKVEDGVEDNQRLHGLVDAFLADPAMTLEDLRDTVLDEFFDEV